MGQRHQIYFILPSETKGQHIVVGLHHQWLYGSKPLRKLDQFLTFVKASVESQHFAFLLPGVPSWMVRHYPVGEHEDSETVRALHAIYGLDLADGSFNSLHTLTDGETIDPRKGDNNDGITIIDLRKPAAPKFAFMFLHAGDADVSAKLQRKPVDARTYLAQYYDRDASNDDDGKLAPDGSWELADTLDASFARLTAAEVRKLFPAMFPRKARKVAA